MQFHIRPNKVKWFSLYAWQTLFGSQPPLKSGHLPLWMVSSWKRKERASRASILEIIGIISQLPSRASFNPYFLVLKNDLLGTATGAFRVFFMLSINKQSVSVEHYSWEKSGILQIQRWQAMLANYFWVICLETNSYCFFGLVLYEPRWWQLKYFLFSPWSLEKWSKLPSIFFKWVIQPPGRKPIFLLYSKGEHHPEVKRHTNIDTLYIHVW